MESLRPNEQRATLAIIMIWIVLVMEIISLVSGYFQYELLQAIANGTEISEEASEANDKREQAISVFYLIVYILSSITFIGWFRRAYYNLDIRVANLTYTEGWAAGSWFVPILNLYRPYQMMQELYGETKKLLVYKKFDLAKNLNSDILGIWWTFWVVSNILGQIIFRYARNANTVDELITYSVLSIVSNVIGIPLALLAIKVIKDYSKVEPLLREIKEDSEETPSSNLLPDYF